jgi:hypothetical protein
MRGTQVKSQWKQAAALVGAGVLFFTVGCASRDGGALRPQELAAAQAGAPVVVSCEPNQRTLVRQAVVNGAPVSQVECVTAATEAAYAQTPAVSQPVAVPASYGYTSRAPRAAAPVYDDLGDAQVVPAAASRTARVAHPVRTSQVVYDERPVRKQRSVKKSAIIIGSSAGAGAGVGAAVGGKKGALIGALIGGGGAAVWDQVTRHRN